MREGEERERVTRGRKEEGKDEKEEGDRQSVRRKRGGREGSKNFHV